MALFECDGCGACCRTFAIFASDADAVREPRIAAEGRRLPGSLSAEGKQYRLFPLPFLDACAFLAPGDRCDIYASRPDVCRAFAAGSPQCQQAREAQGLHPLAAAGEEVAWPHPPRRE
jgi:Fe-S-cluster containining protein